MWYNIQVLYITVLFYIYTFKCVFTFSQRHNDLFKCFFTKYYVTTYVVLNEHISALPVLVYNKFVLQHLHLSS